MKRNTELIDVMHSDIYNISMYKILKQLKFIKKSENY